MQNIMTKQQIAQYSSLKREIIMLENQILFAECGTEFVTDYAKDYSTGYPRIITLQGYGSQDVTKLTARKAKCIAECNAIEKFIENIADSTLRQLFIRRFIEGRSRIETAALAGFTEKHISRLINNYFKKMSLDVP